MILTLPISLSSMLSIFCGNTDNTILSLHFPIFSCLSHLKSKQFKDFTVISEAADSVLCKMGREKNGEMRSTTVTQEEIFLKTVTCPNASEVGAPKKCFVSGKC